MSDLVEIYLFFLVLYLFESLAFVPRQAVGFHNLMGRWRARAAFRPNASWKFSVVPGIPWPPLSPPWIAETLPLALQPDGVTILGDEGETLPWKAFVDVEASGTKVSLDGRVLVSLASRGSATILADTLRAIAGLPEKKRAAALQRFLDERFDPDAAKKRRAEFSHGTHGLRIAANALWFALFGGLGVAVFTQNMLVLLGTATLTILLWPVLSLMFHLTLRKATWLPKDRRPDFSKRLVAMLSPLSGVRAADLLAREAFTNLDPVAVATGLLTKPDLERFARPRLVALAPRDGQADPLAFWRKENRVRMERVLRQAGVDLAILHAAPAPEGGHVDTYCPACHAQYEKGRAAGSHCPSEGCEEIPLRSFGDPGKPC